MYVDVYMYIDIYTYKYVSLHIAVFSGGAWHVPAMSRDAVYQGCRCLNGRRDSMQCNNQNAKMMFNRVTNTSPACNVSTLVSWQMSGKCRAWDVRCRIVHLRVKFSTQT